MRVELPGGQWAEIRGLDELKAKDKVAIQRAVSWEPREDGGIARANAGMAEDMQMALLCQLITAWSPDLGLPVPATPEVLAELPLAAYNELCAATTDHLEVMRVVPNRRTPPA